MEKGKRSDRPSYLAKSKVLPEDVFHFLAILAFAAAMGVFLVWFLVYLWSISIVAFAIVALFVAGIVCLLIAMYCEEH